MGAWGGFVAINVEAYRNVADEFRFGRSNGVVAKYAKQLINLGRLPRAPLRWESIGSSFDEQFIHSTHSRPHNYESLVELFEFSVVNNAARYFTHFGLSVNFFHLLVDSPTEKGKKILERIAMLNSFWMHGSGGNCEGIHFFLRQDEIMELLPFLKLHDDYQAAFEMRMEYEPRFAQIKRTLEFAIENDLGLLWGCDLRVFYSVDWRKKEFGTIVPFDANAYIKSVDLNGSTRS